MHGTARCLARIKMNANEHLRVIFLAAVKSVQTSNLLKSTVKLNDSTLSIARGQEHLAIQLTKPCYVVGFGKGVFGMAAELMRILGDKIQRGVLTVPVGSLSPSKITLTHNERPSFLRTFEIIEGGRENIADAAALAGAQKIDALATSLRADDVLIVLITGGGSALLPLPREGVTLEEKQSLSRDLFRNGAHISVVNCVRKSLSKLKGGGLAKAAYPAKVCALIVSDIVGDPLEFIASGPTAPCQDPLCHNVADILKTYNLYDSASEKLKRVVSQPVPDDMRSPSSEIFKNVKNFIIGNNAIACKAAEEKAAALGYKAEVISTRIEGRVADVAEFYLQIVQYIFSEEQRKLLTKERFPDYVDAEIIAKLEKLSSWRKQHPLCLVFGGEPTVVVPSGGGKGGRNMHLALELAIKLNNFKGVHFVSCGTDGIDGPTDAAGAIAPIGLIDAEWELAQLSLDKSDSYNFFKVHKPDLLITTGHTGTNVMDVHLLIIYPQ